MFWSGIVGGNRQPRYYDTNHRRYLGGNNLQCLECGNDRQFFLDIRLPRRLVLAEPGLVTLETDPERVDAVRDGLASKVRTLVDRDFFRGRQSIRCANCHRGVLDSQERLMDYCYYTGCPGCEVCGNWMPEAELRELCGTCLLDADGQITEEDCFARCPYFDDGLAGIRAHYGFTLTDLKSDLGCAEPVD